MTTYYLIKRDGTVESFSHFADLCNAHLKEYGFFPAGAKAIEGECGNQLFYWC